MNEKRDPLQNALEEAAERVVALPEAIRPAAYAEAFRAIYRSTQEAPPPPTDPVPQLPASGQLPEAVTIVERGTRTHKAVYAAAQLAARGEEATSTTIEAYLADVIASPIRSNKTPDVLKEAVPRYLTRERGDDGRYVYAPTPQGMALLADLAATSAEPN